MICIYIYTRICILYIYDVSNNSHAETRIHKCLSWYWRSSDKSMWLYNVNIFISTVERRHVTIHCSSVCFDWISHDLPAVRACKHQLSCTSNSIGCGWEAAAQVPTVKKKTTTWKLKMSENLNFEISPAFRVTFLVDSHQRTVTKVVNRLIRTRGHLPATRNNSTAHLPRSMCLGLQENAGLVGYIIESWENAQDFRDTPFIFGEPHFLVVFQ
jgi:hypothetical protein